MAALGWKRKTEMVSPGLAFSVCFQYLYGKSKSSALNKWLTKPWTQMDQNWRKCWRNYPQSGKERRLMTKLLIYHGRNGKKLLPPKMQNMTKIKLQSYFCLHMCIAAALFLHFLKHSERVWHGDTEPSWASVLNEHWKRGFPSNASHM